MEADILEILDVLKILGGQGFPEILSDPAELRSTILALEATVSLLKANEQRMYPDQAPKAGKTRRNEVVNDVNDPAWQRDKILRIFQRLRQPLTPAQLHGQYIKSVDATLLEARCDELVGLEELVVLDSKRPDGGRKYCLPSDVPPEPEPAEPPEPKPFTHLTLRGQRVAVYGVSNQEIIGVKDDYNLVINHDQSLAFRISSKDGRKIHEWNLRTDFAHLSGDWMQPVPSDED